MFTYKIKDYNINDLCTRYIDILNDGEEFVEIENYCFFKDIPEKIFNDEWTLRYNKL